MPIVFISHASADGPFVNELYDLLQTGCDLRREDILCSSVESAGIETGQDFIDWIDGGIKAASIVILVLSENYLCSNFCVAELGAAWALEKSVFPLMLPSTGRDPGVVFLGRHSARVDDQGMDDLRDRIAKEHPPTAEGTARWSAKKAIFLGTAPEVMGTLPKPETVSRDAVRAAEEAARAAIDVASEQKRQIRSLQTEMEELRLAKNASEVTAIRKRHAPASELYEAALRELREQLKPLDKVQKRAVLAQVSGEWWHPSREVRDSWGNELDFAIGSSWLLEDDYCAVIANDEHPHYRNVFEAVAQLEGAIRDLPDDIRAEIEAEEGYLIDIRNYQYWEDAILQKGVLQ